MRGNGKRRGNYTIFQIVLFYFLQLPILRESYFNDLNLFYIRITRFIPKIVSLIFFILIEMFFFLYIEIKLVKLL